jgi:hypothetical protein
VTPSIFVQIASYRDPECEATLRDLLDKAAVPGRISVGLCLQNEPGDGPGCGPGALADHAGVRVIHKLAQESRGVCWARSLVQSLWQGEGFTLQLDSHMRFEPDWDQRLLECWHDCEDPKAILSCYPNGFQPPDRLDRDSLPLMAALAFHEDGLPRFQAINRFRLPQERPTRPLPGAYISAGMIFGPAQMIADVPYDPHLYFYGEEATLSARLWTAGYNIYNPNCLAIYHLYKSGATAHSSHWSDHSDWSQHNQIALERARHLLGIAPGRSAPALLDLERYGLGQQRSLEDYQAWSGLDFQNATVADHALAGQFGSPDLQPPQPAPTTPSQERRRIFSAIHAANQGQIVPGDDQNGWESVSGPGSSLAETAKLRRELAAIFEQLEIHNLLDAACGDSHWIAELADRLDLYLGLDIVDALITVNIQRHRGRKMYFQAGDLLTTPLPRADAILCRDCLVHLSNASIAQALKNFKASGSRYLLTTSFPQHQNSSIVQEGYQWQPLNLQAPPFLLGEPLAVIEEYAADVNFEFRDKSLLIWNLTAMEP